MPHHLFGPPHSHPHHHLHAPGPHRHPHHGPMDPFAPPSDSSSIVQEILARAFGQANASILVRCVEYAHPLEAGAKLRLHVIGLDHLLNICDRAGVDTLAITAWLKESLDTSSLHAFGTALLYGPEATSALSRVLPTEETQHTQYRLTHGPWEMQALTLIELANTHITAHILEHLFPAETETDIDTLARKDGDAL